MPPRALGALCCVIMAIETKTAGMACDSVICRSPLRPDVVVAELRPGREARSVLGEILPQTLVVDVGRLGLRLQGTSGQHPGGENMSTFSPPDHLQELLIWKTSAAICTRENPCCGCALKQVEITIVRRSMYSENRGGREGGRDCSNWTTGS